MLLISCLLPFYSGGDRLLAWKDPAGTLTFSNMLLQKDNGIALRNKIIGEVEACR